ncbi:MAG: histidine kinase [Spirochaetota bacterium]
MTAQRKWIRLALRHRLFLAFSGYLVAVAVPMAILFLVVSSAYRDLAAMQSRQSEISGLIAATDEAYELFTKYSYTREGTLLAEYSKHEAGIALSSSHLDSELPADFHYYLYDISSMHRSFSELAQSIRSDVEGGMERIFLDKRLAELNRTRGYISEEYSRLLTDYLEHVRGRSEELRADLDRSERITFIVMALVLLGGALLAGRISAGIASPIRRLADSLGRFSGGELGMPPLPVTRGDEIGVVIDSFNRMTTEIRAHVEAIHEKANIEAELAEQHLRLLEAENALKHAEIRWLQNQVNPHFIYNAFNSILSLARLEDAKRTASSVESLAVLLRNALRSGRAMNSLGEEMEVVRHYLLIQKTRFGKRLEFSLDLPEGLGAERLPAMILQPFVENAVIHGIEPRDKGGSLVVEARARENGGILLLVKDDGMGFSPESLRPVGDELGLSSLEDGRHIGIANSRRRMELLYGGTREYIRISSESGKGTEVRMEIPPESELLEA